jgi:hypothetical protein
VKWKEEATMAIYAHKKRQDEFQTNPSTHPCDANALVRREMRHDEEFKRREQHVPCESHEKNNAERRILKIRIHV